MTLVTLRGTREAYIVITRIRILTMKFLKRLLGQDTDETPTWDVTPADLRPPPRRRAAAVAEIEESEQKSDANEEDNPFLTDAFQKFELEGDGANQDDPYQSYSWSMDPSSETRKLKKIKVGKHTEKASKKDDFNPYDTGVFKRGWK